LSHTHQGKNLNSEVQRGKNYKVDTKDAEEIQVDNKYINVFTLSNKNWWYLSFGKNSMYDVSAYTEYLGNITVVFR
jgi:hypothetical protein